ncbi:hypothetical protein PC9H_009223 [Pleurotus ostreatus]|uniref:Uncharacterized protein n=1 Tax=Pleurotus ostreatus TaxID=5322 RepID=A0A8H7DP32_PLEOS|nr:uncharacterized protein PC9H_009223 [Pleurotus ostreatus]KAF7423925.1 hypothetical protein PC9H_009223 [Pleurotus ostreatus]KAJ8693276.1 hypothetical protein PTI98_010512 [Pleurotus ostreatus]
MDCKRHFTRLQSWVFSIVVGLSCVIIVAELYGIAVMAALGPGAVVPASMGFATALFTVLSVGPMSYSPSSSFITTVMFQTVWLSILCVLWLSTGALTHTIRETLAPDGCDALAGHERSVCGQLPFVELYCYIISAALLIYTLALSALTTKAVVDGHPGVWTASAWDLPYNKVLPYTKDPSTEALLYEEV